MFTSTSGGPRSWRQRATTVIGAAGAVALTSGVVVLGVAAPASAHKTHFGGDCDGVWIDAQSYKADKANIWSITIDGQTQSGTFGSTFNKRFAVPQTGKEIEWSAYTKQPDGEYYWDYEDTVGPCGDDEGENGEKPPKPAPVVKEWEKQRKSCEGGKEEQDYTQTTDWVWDAEEWEWVLGEPEIDKGEWHKERDLRPDEMDDYDCPKPEEPADKVVETVEERMSCEDGVEQRTETVTTEYEFDEDTWTWVLDDDSETTYSDWEQVRDLTDEEKAELECAEVGPAVGVVTGLEDRTSCENGLEQRTKTVTTVTTVDAETGDDVVDETVAYSPWKTVDTLTAAEKAELGCDEVAGTEGEKEPTVAGTQAPAPSAGVPTAVDAGLAGLGGTTPTSGSTADLVGFGLTGGGLAMLLLALAMRQGRRELGAHQV